MAYARLIQTHQGMSVNYEAISNDRILANARVPLNISSGEILYTEDGDLKYRLKYFLVGNLKNLTKGKTDKKISQYDILNEYDDKVGSIYGKETKGFFKSYSYTQIDFYDKTYIGYGIGMGKEGYKYPIYEGEKQVALIEKDNIVKDMKDIYHIYTLDEEIIEMVVLYCLRLDMIAYGNFGQFPIASEQASYTYTWDKTLKSKYNPIFKDQCL